VGNPSQSDQAREDRVPRTPPQAVSVPIWAFAGGKGGVGKSIVALNVATHLALTGRRVVLVDAEPPDLAGGPQAPVHAVEFRGPCGRLS
jgi:Mrp family chromosome partitioning ATPase